MATFGGEVGSFYGAFTTAFMLAKILNELDDLSLAVSAIAKTVNFMETQVQNIQSMVSLHP